MIVIALNGPPRCGKDTAAKAVYATLTSLGKVALLEKFSLPIKRACHGLLLPYINKDEIDPVLGCTPRQWHIEFSENFMKKLYGQDIFGRLLAHRINRTPQPDFVVVSDCGFQSELDVLAACDQISSIWIISISRFGCLFDSRGLVKTPNGKPGRFATLTNNRTLEDFSGQVSMCVDTWLKKEGINA